MKTLTKVILITAFIFSYLQNSSLAQSPGDLDSTFGIGGKVTTDISGYIDVAYGMALQEDGKIILTGYSLESNQTYREITLVRYLSDGSIDDSFGNNGIVKSDVSDRMGEAYAIAIQPDHKIVVTGYSESSSTDEDNFTTIRYEATGNPDNTFGTNGIVITDVGPDNNRGESIAIQNDGKIIIAGWLVNNLTDDIALVRYNTDGSKDISFGGISGNGIIITDISSADYGKDVALQADGKIVVTGNSVDFILGQGSIFVARYDSIGILDASFGNGGIVTTTIGSNYAYGQAVTIQQDGKILIAGFSNQSINNYHFTLIRYNADGSLDNSFGTNGIVVTPIGSQSFAYSIALDYKGAILVGGTSDNDFALARYDSSGNLDGSFGAGGIVITNFTGSSIDKGYSLAIQSDNKIVLAGETENGFSDFAMARYIDRLPEITVLSPNGGENWEAGTTEQITWQYYGVINVKIEYTTNNGSSWQQIVSNYPASNGAYSWLIPNTPSSQCKVRISDMLNPNTYDLSDNPFAIIPSTSTITVLIPNGGETWIIGSIQDIEWLSEAVIDVKIDLSLNNGATWITIIDSTPSTGIYSWEVQASSPSIQCLIRITDLANATVFDISDNIFEIDLINSVDEKFSGIPTEFVLIQNYPNPFNPVTKIYYGIPEVSFIELAVYDILGNTLVKLVSETKDAGYYSIEFDALTLPSGVYFYRLQAGSFVETKKMVLMK